MKESEAVIVLKYFLYETIHAQQNGSRGTHFAKFLISKFSKGLTYSAMLLKKGVKAAIVPLCDPSNDQLANTCGNPPPIVLLL